MVCHVCGECYDDDKYIEKLDRLEDYNHFDQIDLNTWVNNFKPPKTYTWYKKCDKFMDDMIEELSKPFKQWTDIHEEA